MSRKISDPSPPAVGSSVNDQAPYLQTVQNRLARALTAHDLDPEQSHKIELTSESHYIDSFDDGPASVSAGRVDQASKEIAAWLNDHGWELTKTSEETKTGFGDHYRTRYTAKFAHVRRISGFDDAFAADRSAGQTEVRNERDALLSQTIDALEGQLPTGSDVAVIDLTSQPINLSLGQVDTIKGDLKRKLGAAGFGRVGFRLQRKTGHGWDGPVYWVAHSLVIGRQAQPTRAALESLAFGFGHAVARAQQFLDSR